MREIPVIVFKNKAKVDRYLATELDAGDWSDPDLDVSIAEIENAFMIYRDDLSKPDETDVEALMRASKAHKEYMIERFGRDATISFDVELWLQYYDPVDLEITAKQFELAKEWDE